MSKNKFSRRALLSTSAAAAAGLSGVAAEHETDGKSHSGGGVWERPPDQKDRGNRLNLILLNVDTFRADNLECYGSKFIDCPNLNRFSQECVIFEDAYPEGMPTIPIRRTLMTGRRILPFYYYPQHEIIQMPGWHELYHEDVTWAETLHEAGYITALVCDILHFLRPGRNFHRGYRYFEWERGHSFDYSATVPHEGIDISDVVPADYLETWSSFAGEDVRWFLNQYGSSGILVAGGGE